MKSFTSPQAMYTQISLFPPFWGRKAENIKAPKRKEAQFEYYECQPVQTS